MEQADLCIALSRASEQIETLFFCFYVLANWAL